MDARVEDRIVVESERSAQSGRAGVIEEVLAQDPPRFRVRWDDGHESLFHPGSDATVRHSTHRRASPKAKR